MATPKKKSGKAGSKAKSKAKKEVRESGTEEVQTLLTSAPPAEPSPQTTETPPSAPKDLPVEATDPQVPSVPKGD